MVDLRLGELCCAGCFAFCRSAPSRQANGQHGERLPCHETVRFCAGDDESTKTCGPVLLVSFHLQVMNLASYFAQVCGATINVALADFHTSAAIATTFVLLVGLLVVITTHRPFAHAFLNRLSGFYVCVNLVFYGGALFALQQAAQPESTSSADFVLQGLAAMLVLYLIGEAYSFRKVPHRDAPAGGFGQYHVAWNFGDIYAITRNGVPTDQEGRPCSDIYNRHTGVRLVEGSGNPAAISNNYRDNGRPAKYKAATERQRKKEDAKDQKRKNKKQMKQSLMEEARLRKGVQQEKKPVTSSSFDLETGSRHSNPVASQPSRTKELTETLQEKLDNKTISDKDLRLLLSEEAEKFGKSKLLMRVDELNSKGSPREQVSRHHHALCPRCLLDKLDASVCAKMHG